MARWRRPWHFPKRSTEPPASPAAVTDLLERIRALRLTLDADLAAAAGALDSGEPQVAGDIIDADRGEVQRLTAAAAPAPQREPEPVPQRRRRALLTLPAIPLVAALAVTGASALTSPAPSHQPPRRTHPREPVTDAGAPASVRATAATTLHQLELVVSRTHHRQQVVTLADHLHHQLSVLIASSPHDGRQLGEVQRLLSVEQTLLRSHRGDGAAIALAASRQVTKLLAATGITRVSVTLPPVLTKPTQPAAASPSPTITTSHRSIPRPTTTSTPTPTPSPKQLHPIAPTPHRHHHHHFTNPLSDGGLLNIGL